MIRFARGSVPCALIGALARLAVAQPGAHCREGKPLTGDIGIGGFQCVAAGCAVNGLSGGRYHHSFSAEPYILDVDSTGPAASLLRDGDVLVAVDGLLITTVEAGDRLANLIPGQPVSLRVRRAGKDLEVRVTPRLGCNMPYIMVTPDRRRFPVPPRAPADP
jgi:S1-C subfamily serine protease